LKRFVALTLVLLATIVLLGGCKQLEEGTIVAKEHSDAHTNLVLLPVTMTHTIGSTTYTTVNMVPYWIYTPEHWALTIEGTLEGEPKRRTVYVDAKVFHAVKVGDWYTVSDNDQTKLVTTKQEAN
jgi:hypothetical protein